MRIDFDAAIGFIHEARDAYVKGDEMKCYAARKLAAVALCLDEKPPVVVTEESRR